MQTVSANEAKARFGAVIEQVQREPVMITRHGRASAVVLSATEYEHLTGLLESLEDHYWFERAREAEKDGFCGVEESQSFIASLRSQHALP